MHFDKLSTAVARIDAWLAEHRKELFLASLAIVIGIDVYNMLVLDAAPFSLKFQSYTQFLSLLLRLNFIYYFFIPLYFIQIETCSLVIYSLIVILLLHIYYFFAPVYDQDGYLLIALAILNILPRQIFYFIISLVFLREAINKKAIEFKIYVSLLILYFPLYFSLILFLALRNIQ